MEWRSGRLSTGPRDPPFNPSTVHEQVFEDGETEVDAESTYEHVPPVSQRHSAYEDSNVAHAPYSDNSGVGQFRDSIGPPAGSPPTANFPEQPPLQSVPAGRPSMDIYGAFSDPAPSGFGGASSGAGYAAPPAAAPLAPPSPSGAPALSRTMQYADPYAAVRASIGGAAALGGGRSTPPSYDYQGYR